MRPVQVLKLLAVFCGIALPTHKSFAQAALQCRYDEAGCVDCDICDCYIHLPGRTCCARRGVLLCATIPLRGPLCWHFPFCNDMPCSSSIVEFVQKFLIDGLANGSVTPDDL